MEKPFRAMLVREAHGQVSYQIEEISQEMLSEGDVVIKVAYSSVNYKDMLAVQSRGGVIRNYPMIPGIDVSGTVVASCSNQYKCSQKVLVTGFQMGMTHTGGYSEYVRLPAEWLVPLPEGLSLKEAMVMGTAGFTAALSINLLESAGMSPDQEQEILVTGATGGVGSIALQLLKASGYKKIYALTRKASEQEKLMALGAKEVLLVDDILTEKPKLLDKQKFNYVLDAVGGPVAAGLLPQIHYGGSISMCGNAAGLMLETSVMPFILRGISILGVDSVNYPIEKRQAIWDRFADEWHIMEGSLVTEVELEALRGVFNQIKEGSHIGRYVVKVAK